MPYRPGTSQSLPPGGNAAIIDHVFFMISVSRAKWLKTRLTSMGPAEVGSRLADLGWHVMLRAFLGQMQKQRNSWLNGMDHQPNIPIVHVPLAGAGGEDEMLELAHAAQWLSHRANFFSLENIPLGNPIDWHRNYASGIRGPLNYSGLINHRDPTVVGDVKYVWELNRLQHLVLLGLAFRKTKSVTYRDELVRQTLSWISSNPFMMGVNWKSPLEAALRLISWACVYCLVGNELPAIFHEKLRISIYQHQYFIWKFYSKYSSANNHLIGEMAGLYIASTIWPFYRKSKTWSAMARETLVHQMMQQVEPDGVGRELAVEYQLFILELLLMAGALGEVIGDPFPRPYWQRLNCMVHFLSAISDHNGNFPLFGDGDGSQVIALPHTPPVRARSLVHIGRPCHEPVSKPVDLDMRIQLLLWGQQVENFPLVQQAGRPRGLRPFPQGGYYVLADGEDPDSIMKVVFDAGQLGLPPLYAHGHADALSFWLSYGGQEFLVDPGTFSYYDRVWGDYFRSTVAHNTMRVDSENQSIPVGRFQWSYAARSQVHHIQETDDWIEVEAFHDGYRRLKDPVIHHRCIRLFKRSKNVAITDRLTCNDRHDVEIYFHLHENSRVRQTGISSFTADIQNLRLRMNLDSQLRYEVVRGSERPILGWVSRKYGVKTASMTIVGRGRLSGSQKIVSEISPG
jgi:Heparinase II/III-like protein/Heparinase II/III N-terminus